MLDLFPLTAQLQPQILKDLFLVGEKGGRVLLGADLAGSLFNTQ